MANKNDASPAEDRLWQWLESAATESNRIKRKIADFDSFESNTDLFYGKHYPQTLPSYRPPVVVNEFRTLLLQESSDLADTGFRPYILKDPQRGGRDEAAERAMRAIWVRDQIELRLIEATVWAGIMGTGFLRVTWDPTAFYGMGDVAVDVWDPRNVHPDPDALDDRKMSFVIYETVLDIPVIRQLFPKTGGLVEPEDQYSDKDTGLSATGGVSPNLTPGSPYAGPLSDTDSLIGNAYPGYKKARARVLDCYVDDPSLTRTFEQMLDPSGAPVLDEVGNPKFKETLTMKYPEGRRIVGANGRILYDGKNNNPAGSKGLVRVILEPTLTSFWGTGWAQQTGALQLAADKLTSGIVENSIRLNNGIIVVEGNTGLDWESFTSIPGQVVQINQGSKFDIKYPPTMPDSMINAPERLLGMQRRILGFPDQRTGQGGRGNVSPDLTETEISAAQGITRLRARYLYYAVQRLAEMIFAQMTAGYTTSRYIPAVEGELFKPVQWEPIERPDRYAVYLDPAAFQILSRSMVRRMSLALYKMQAVDRKALLENINFPDADAVAKRLDEQEKAMAMAKMQARSGKKK